MKVNNSETYSCASDDSVLRDDVGKAVISLSPRFLQVPTITLFTDHTHCININVRYVCN